MVNQRGGLLALATILLMALAFHFHLSALRNRPAVDVKINDLPYQLGNWKGRDTAGLDVRSQGVLRLDRYVKREYTNPDGEPILLYIGYWKKQTGDYQAAKHSPLLCLPSNGWFIERKDPRALALKDPELSSVKVRRLIGAFGDRKQLFYYWFFTGEKNYSEDWKALLTISLQTFLAGRSDGGIIEISTPLGGGEGERGSIEHRSALIEDFFSSFYPELHKLIISKGA